MRLLVTGGLGNVGSHLVAELLRRGHDVRVLERRCLRTRRAARRYAAEVVWGDVADRATVEPALAGVDVVYHLAAVIPPESDERPDEARRTNVDGTAVVIAACEAQPTRPRLLFTSTFDVHGHTQRNPPPRRVDDPVEATDPYSGHKIEAEALLCGSTLDWCLVRLSDVPVIGVRRPPALMFEIGPRQALLRYQRHSFEDIVTAIATAAGWKRRVVSAIAPLARLALLRMSPHYRRRR